MEHVCIHSHFEFSLKQTHKSLSSIMNQNGCALILFFSKWNMRLKEKYKQKFLTAPRHNHICSRSSKCIHELQPPESKNRMMMTSSIDVLCGIGKFVCYR